MPRRARNYRLRNYVTGPALVTIGGTLAICALAFANPSPRGALLIWNASASAPIGLYRVIHETNAARGDLMLAIPDRSVAVFAARRGYLPIGVPLVKRVAAIAGDTVCAHGDAILIDGNRTATRLVADREGRPLPYWSGCRTLARGDVFLLMANVRDSFDGRYFGPTKASDIVGRLVPLWTR